MTTPPAPLILRDEIHGDISLDAVARAVVDHPGFQRLRYIKQLGLAEYVFPCATHTRFQHSLGAGFLAKEYFESLIETWPDWEFEFDGQVGSTRFLVRETRECVVAVAGHGPSREYWSRVAALAGVLHDVGHGPWSHTFEYLDLRLDIASRVAPLKGTVRKYFDALACEHRSVLHEDLSVLYAFRILGDLEKQGQVPNALDYFLPIAALVNKRLVTGSLMRDLEVELEQALGRQHLKGGMSMLRLLAPLLSGPFDVDRADYIQRDGRNCGVSLGGIEWKRIVRKVMPCLAVHPNGNGEPNDVILLSHLKNQNVLDDFIFSLFQMYVQVYLHPKIVAFEEQVRRELDARVPKAGKPLISFELHEQFSDEAFRLWLEKEFGADGIRPILFRDRDHRFQVIGLPPGKGKEAGLPKAGFLCVQTQARPMLKDGVGVFLFSGAVAGHGKGKGGAAVVLPWTQASPIANQMHLVKYSIEVWMKTEGMTK